MHYLCKCIPIFSIGNVFYTLYRAGKNLIYKVTCPKNILNCRSIFHHFLLHKVKINLFVDLQFAFFLDVLNFTKIKNVCRKIFVILSVHKPSLIGSEVQHKIWARSVLPFQLVLDKNKQRDL